jgi:Molybdopterin-binding domain of aldehyde dehydrogenase/CO dehydrogenase flavoprotein C-terminal domain
MGMIAAEALGVPLSQVDVVAGDTDRCPYSVGESGSRTTIMTGMAVVEAVKDLQQQIAARGMPTGDDILVASVTPSPTPDGKKITDREAWTHAEVSVAVMLQLEDRRIRTASVVLGGVAPIPWRLTDVEQWLRGTSLSAAVARRAGALAVAHAQPLAKNSHKVPMTSAAVERALLRLVPA